MVASRVNADFQPLATLRGGAGPQREQMPVAVQYPNEVCVSIGVRITSFNVCSAVEVDKKFGFERRHGKARCLAITSGWPPRPAGAAPLRGHCDAGKEKESTTISGGLTRSLHKLHVRQALQHAARAPLRVSLLAN